MATSNKFAAIEHLEKRSLLSAGAPTDDVVAAAVTERYSLMSLLGYHRKGSNFRYRTTGEAESNVTDDPQAIAVTHTKRVGTQTQNFDGKPSNLVSLGAEIGGVTQNTAWFSDRTGTYVTGETVNYEGNELNVTVQGLRVAPRYMTLGKKYTDSGTFSGNFEGEALGTSVDGTVTGTSSASSKLFARETITVRGQEYNAVRGVYSVTLRGTATVEVLGQEIDIPVEVVESQTFWSVPGLGVVTADTQLRAQAEPPVQDTIFATAKFNSDLISYVLG